MNQPLPTSFAPETSETILSRSREKVTVVPHVALPRRRFCEVTESSRPFVSVAPMFCTTDDTPLLSGRKRCSRRSVVLVRYASNVALTRLCHSTRSNPTFVVCDSSHLRFGLPIWLLNV